VLQVGLLGPVTVEADGQPIQVRRPLELALLARLALSPGQMVSTDRLMVDLWAERQVADPLGSLQAVVYRLRRALGPEDQALRREGSGYKLAVPADAVDAGRFHALVAQAHAGPADDGPGRRRSLLTTALGLWRGPALAGLEALPYVDAQRVRLEGAHLTALEERLDADLECGAHREVVSELEGLVVDYPFRERLWAQLVTALYRSGLQTDALRACTRLKELLVEQLGVDPSPMIRALEDAVLRQDPALDWHGEAGAARCESTSPTTAPAPGANTDALAAAEAASRRAEPSEPRRRTNVPTVLSRFIGRAEELATVDKLVADNRLVTLTGPGGVGKTRLAIELASKMYKQFPDGVWLVDLAPLRDGELLPGTIASALGITLSPGRRELVHLSDFIASRHLMLLIDNCEHLLGPVVEVVNVLLGQCPQLVVLATSREPLRTEGEVVWRVPPLSVPAHEAATVLQDVLSFDAVRLFIDRALSARPQLSITEADAKALAEVVGRLDGLPLAIELAAGRLGALGLPDLASRLDQRLDLLNKGFRGGSARHQGLVATIEWSYQLLDERAQSAFRALSVFAGSFGIEGATAVLGAEMAPGAAFDVLADLVDKSLVVLVEAPGESRYRLLETVREYATGLLHSCGESDEARRRLLGWAIALAEQGAQGTGSTATWLDRVDLELANVREALGWALSGGSVEQGLWASTSLVWYWTGRARVAEGRSWLDRLLGCPDVGRSPLRAVALAAAGFLVGEQHSGAEAEAVALCEQGVAIARETDDRIALAWALSSLGGALRRTGRLEDARTCLEEALGLAEQVGLQTVAEMAEYSLVAVDYETDNYADAMRRAERCIASSRASGNLRVLSGALAYQGGLKEDAGDYVAAMDLYQEALGCTRRMGDISFIASALQTIGYCLLNQGEFEHARRYFEDSLALGDAGQQESEAWFASGLRSLAELHFELGDYATARALLNKALRQAAVPDDVRSQWYTLLRLGNLELIGGDRRAALRYHQKALRATLAKREVIRCLEGMATSLNENEEPREAVVMLASAEKARRDTGLVVYPRQRQRQARQRDELKEALGQDVFRNAWAEGRALSVEQAKNLALALATALLGLTSEAT
jgi:predicted ATPase/DNA-binding SARP family transcriptional activator